MGAVTENAKDMRPITIWKRFVDNERRFEFNHIEDGHVRYDQRIPTAKFPHQASNWAGSLWIKFHGYLNENDQVVEG